MVRNEELTAMEDPGSGGGGGSEPWRTRDELEEITRELIDALTEMWRNEDKPMQGDHEGTDDFNDVAPHLRNNTEDTPDLGPKRAFDSALMGIAEGFLSVDPEQLESVYEDTYQAAIRIGDTSEYLDDLRLAADHLSAWHGKAADEFKKQITRTEVFMTSQGNFATETVKAVRAAFAVNVSARQSYYDLANATISIVKNETTRHAEATSPITLLKEAAANSWKSTLRKDIVGVLEGGVKAFVKIVNDGKAAHVANNFGKHCRNLQADHESALSDIQGKLASTAEGIAKTRLEILEPLPSRYTDIDSPDFSYENFYSAHRDTESFGRKLEKDMEHDSDNEDSKDGRSPIEKRLNPE
jgi:hypothetical protein